VGYSAGESVTTGIQNTIVGGLAGDALTDADFNVALGYASLSTDTRGSRSVALGHAALNAQNFTTATDTYNTGLGFHAGLAVTTGIQNTFVGGLAGDSLTTGNNNTFVGFSSGTDGTTTGSDNTAIGTASLPSLTSGSSNCAMGQNAAPAITTGSNNLCLGHDAGRTGSPGGNIITGSNEIVLGDENITNIYAAVSSISTSDERDKTDFTALGLGLDFVKALEPVTYYWDKRSKYGDKYADDYDLNAQTPDGTHKEDWMDVGFKAQAVIALEEAAGYKISDKTNLISNLTDDGTQYGLKYDRFVPILVKAIQEQNALITALTDRIAVLEG
jgi:hypothetical protein